MRVFLLVCFVAALGFEQSHAALAQQSASQATASLSANIIDGSKDPNRIPDRTIQSALMMNLAMMLKQRPDRFAAIAKDIGLSSADTDAMKPHLSRLQETLVTLRSQSKAAADGGSGIPLSDPVQRAAQAKPMVEAVQRSTVDAWDGALDSVSAQGRGALLRYMQREKRNVKIFAPSRARTNQGSAQ